MPDSQTHLSNFLSDTIQSVVRDEVLDYKSSKGKLYKRPRIFNDLLSAQALSFNLFGELQRNLPLATQTFRSLAPARIQSVTSIQFEHSPPGSAPFEVFLQYTTPANTKGFAGITFKYHEDLAGQPAPHQNAYDTLSQKMACFKPESLRKLRNLPLQSLWRDHLQTGSLKLADNYADAFFLFLSPEQNLACHSAVTAYTAALSSTETFLPTTLESFTRQIRPHTKDPWLDRFQDRYLNFGKVDALLAKA
jgi:hypothetical protein